MTENLTRIGNGTTVHLPLTMVTEATPPQMRTTVAALPQMRITVVAGMAVIPTLIRTAATDGPHLPRTTIIEIDMSTISSLLHSAMIAETRFPAAMKRRMCTGTTLDHLLTAATLGGIHFPGIMVMNTPIIEAVATPRAGHTQITATMSDEQMPITMAITTAPPTVHLETVDPRTRTTMIII